jgi:dynein heavy chain
MYPENGKKSQAKLFLLINKILFRNLDFEKLIKQATVDLKLQPEDSFILKVVQLQELFEVRHSVFIVGNAGTGKSQIWKVLNRTYFNQKRKPVAVDLNPKAVTNDELFGIINPATREWKDGLFSTIMRDLANVTSDGKKRIKKLDKIYLLFL